MQASILNLMWMAVSVGVLVAPYALLRSLDTRSSAKFVILALTFACAVVFWPLALYFMLAACACIYHASPASK